MVTPATVVLPSTALASVTVSGSLAGCSAMGTSSMFTFSSSAMLFDVLVIDE